MQHLDGKTLLQVWEEGMSAPPLGKALILLAVARPGVDSETLAQLPIGRRDRILLELRERWFGPCLVNTAECPQCSERLEWETRITDLLTTESDKEEGTHDQVLEKGNYVVRFRLPNSLDVGTVIDISDPKEAQRRLLRRCILQVELQDKSIDTDELPDSVIEALFQRMEILDPLAEIRFNLQCPRCSHRWSALFDIVTFLWSELDEWAKRTLQSVHLLARAYGWSEAAILNLSPVRRQIYLAMVES